MKNIYFLILGLLTLTAFTAWNFIQVVETTLIDGRKVKLSAASGEQISVNYPDGSQELV